MEENVKISKIASEFSLYLLNLGMESIEMQLQKKDKEVVLIFECDYLEESVLKEMVHHLKKKRDQAFEIYGWELIGQADSDNELGLIGNLIDDFKYQIKDRKVIFELIRYEN